MDTNRLRLIDEAKSTGSAFWTRIADDLAKSGRNRRAVNLSRIARSSKAGETVVVPGKVLGDGEIEHKVTVAAFSFSQSALEKLQQAQCKTLSIEEFLKKDPKGSGRIIG